jgi:hypothetical protein
MEVRSNSYKRQGQKHEHRGEKKEEFEEEKKKSKWNETETILVRLKTR